jgi:hypothetical protein
MPFSFATLAKRWPIVDEGAPVTLLQHALHRMELAGEFADNVPVVLYILWKPFEIAALAAISGVLFDATAFHPERARRRGGVCTGEPIGRIEGAAQPAPPHRPQQPLHAGRRAMSILNWPKSGPARPSSAVRFEAAEFQVMDDERLIAFAELQMAAA